jgi:hypothetical protein
MGKFLPLALCLITTAFIVTFGFMVSSYSVIELTQVGLRINKFSKKIDNVTVYLPGRYAVGPFHNFEIFNTKWQWMTFMKGGDSAVIQSKTNKQANIFLEI